MEWFVINLHWIVSILWIKFMLIVGIIVNRYTRLKQDVRSLKADKADYKEEFKGINEKLNAIQINLGVVLDRQERNSRS